MLIGYMLDTSIGPYGREPPEGDTAADLAERLLAEGCAAADAGFDSIVVPERHMRADCVWPDALTLLALLARETVHVRLGTYATVLTLHAPMAYAERLAIIDLLSRGRTFVTVARGFHPDYQRMVGLDPARLTTRFIESIEVVRRAWVGERFSYSGRVVQLEDVFLTPLPHQRPAGPPIWGAGHTGSAAARAATYASAWAGGFFPIEPDGWRATAGAYRTAADEAGTPSFVAIVRAGFVAETRSAARSAALGPIRDELAFYGDWESSFPSASPEALERHVVLGTPEDCVATLRRLERELGLDYVVMRMRMPNGPSIEATIDAIRLFGDEVLPHVQGDRHAASPALPRLS